MVRTINYFSGCMMRNVEYRIIFPKSFDGVKDEEVKAPDLNIVILLHGFCECSLDYPRNTNIEELADKHGLCVILPNGENSFYLDGEATGRKYCTYVGQEILSNARERFGLTDNKEKTIIGGSSMGGFGAIHTALAFPETFGGAFGMSSALILNLVGAGEAASSHAMANQAYYDLVFGKAEDFASSKNDPRVLVKELVEKGQEIPAIRMSCGTSDFLLNENRYFDSFLTEQGVVHTYTEGEGNHDFVFWKAQLEPSICELLHI